MSKAAIQALQTLGEEDLINHACLAEFQKGVSQAALMRKYGIGRDRLYKVLHGKIRPRGTQYQTLKKEETKVKTEPRDVPMQAPRRKGRGKMTVKTSTSLPPPTKNTKPRSFSGLPNIPKVKYPMKSFLP